MPGRAFLGWEPALTTEVMAPMVGKVLRLAANVGDRVNEDDPVVVIEAMKMEIEVVAPAGGTIAEIRVAPGDTVDPDTVLAVID
jgi:biotin carboxyl carrier protein